MDFIMISIAALFLASGIIPVQVDGKNIHYISTSHNSYTKFHNAPEKLIKNFTELNFLSGSYTIQENFVITNANNVSIVGNSSTVTFDCSGMNTSLLITNSTFIEIRNIRFLECGNHISSEHSAFSFPSFSRAAIFIYNVSSLVISNIIIGNSCGHGIIGVNILGIGYYLKKS